MRAPRCSEAIRLIQIHIWLLFLIPPALRFAPLGASGSPALVFAVGMFLLWSVTVLSPSLSTQRRCPPVRIVLAVLWASVLVSYGAMHRFAVATDITANSDRFIITMIAFSGVALFVAEGVETMDELMKVVRTFVAATATMALVALMQSRLDFDLTRYIARIPLLSTNRELTSVLTRSGLDRPAGTATHPIEFGVVVGLGLAFVIHISLYDRVWSKTGRRVALALIALGIPIAVSRSALLVGVIVLIAFVVGATNAVRLRVIPALMVFLPTVFVAFPGLLGTLKGFFVVGAGDASIATRVSDYAFVGPLLKSSPWVGIGPGSMLPRIRILDNQYLMTLVEMGFIGLVALLIAFGTIAWLGRGGRKRFVEEGDRLLGQMFAAAGCGTLASAITFDALSFQMFTGVVALLVGLAGRYWCLGREEEHRRRSMAAPQPAAVGAARSSPDDP